MILRNFLGGLLEARSSLENPSTDLYQALTQGLDAGAPAASGTLVNSRTALRSVPVFAAVRLIAESIGMLPLGVYRREGQTRRALRLPADRHIWGRPNPEMTAPFFWETVVGHCVLTGDAFIYTTRDELGRIAELWPVNPRTVTLRRVAGEKIYWVGGEAFTGYDICHIPAFSGDGLRGLSPIGVAREAIGLALATEEYGARFFSQGSTVAGVIEAQDELTPAQAAALRVAWQRAHAGSKNAHKVAVLDKKATWKQVGINPEDAQFLQTRDFQALEIARLFRVPPHLIGIVDRTTSWGTGIEEQTRAFLNFTLQPWLTRVEAAISEFLLPVADRIARFDTDGLLRPSLKERWEVYRIMRTLGTYNNDEIREKEGDDPIAGAEGQDYRQPLNTNSAGGADKGPTPAGDGAS